MKTRIRKKRIKAANATKPFLCKVEGIDELKKKFPEVTFDYPFNDGDIVLMLGEVEQNPGHVAIALRDGRVLFGYHAEHFRRLSLEEA